MKIIEDTYERPRLLVGDADDQCHEANGSRAAVFEAFELLASVGPLSRNDVIEVIRGLEKT